MIQKGLVKEARQVEDKRHLNALNTVGYKELFAHFDGEYNIERAIELIQRNTRHYAKKQLSWFNGDNEINWFTPNEKKRIMEFVSDKK